MKRFIKASVITILTSAAYIGCSDVEFNEIPQDEFFPNCVIKAEYGDRCTYSGNTDLGEVDILFVDDNSGSMSTEQAKMADKFNNFIETLDGQNINYNISITTTHISGPLANGDVVPFQSYGDGNFINFPNGAKVLKSGSLTQAERVSYFAQTIQRPETTVCEQSGYDNCPSSDERGIYAINKVLDIADKDFFRPGSHFAVVILSDEDERSSGGDRGDLTDQDKPETLVSRLAQTLGPMKSMSVHAIVVPPGNYLCKALQDAQGNGHVFGFYGTQYAALANPSTELKALGNIVPGKLGNICSADYTSQLKDMASKISTETFNITLPCAPVADEVAAAEGFSAVSINVSPDPGFAISFAVDTSNRVTFTPSLPAGSKVTYEVACKRK